MPQNICRLTFALLTSALIVLLMSVCLSAQSTTQPGHNAEPSSRPSLVGVWKVERALTQLGPMTITYDFASDGRVTISMAQIDGGKLVLSGEGTYQIDGEHLLIKHGAKETKHTFKIDGDNLTIIEDLPNGDRFDLKRQPSSRSATKPAGN